MDGTADTYSIPESGDPSPLIAALVARQQAFAFGGAAVNGTREQRRALLRRDMEMVRLGSMESALAVTEEIAGRAPLGQSGYPRDPLTSLANLNRSIIQIALLEERLDETDDERAARLVTEAEAARKAEADRAYGASQLRRAENRRQVQGGVRAVTLTGLGLSYLQREKLLADLFKELDTIDAYDAEPAEVIADICLRLGIDTDELPKRAASHLARKDEMASLARTHLEALRGRHVVDGEDEPVVTDVSSAPRAHAQGPPH
jgi:hypothetical protein